MSEIIYSEIPVKEIWSRLGYFENEHNAREYLSEKNKKLNKNLTEEQLTDIAKRLSFSMQSAKEYYQSASSVSLLTKPLLLFYGMVALSKGLFISTHFKKSPSTGHGLESPKDDFNNIFCSISTTVKKDGSFPQFHGCCSRETFYQMRFTLNELLSAVPDVKAEYEAVFKKKSNSVELQKKSWSYKIADDDGLEKYESLNRTMSGLVSNSLFDSYKYTGKSAWLSHLPKTFPTIRTLAGKEFLLLYFNKNGRDFFIPERSAHYLIMYLLGMASRYYPKEWGEIVEGKVSGDIYVIKKFLEITERKFPNLILNSLRNKEYVFVSPSLEDGLSDDDLDRVWEHVEQQLRNKLGDKFPR